MANNNNDEDLQQVLLQQFGPGAELDPGMVVPPLAGPGVNNNGEDGEELNNDNNEQGGPAPPLPGAPGPGNNNNNNDYDDDEWPENAAPAPPGPPAAPKPPKKKKFATDLTEPEKAALLTPRAAAPQSFDPDVTARVEDALYQVLKVGFDTVHPGKPKDKCIEILRLILEDTKAVLSGGYILKQILNVPDDVWEIPYKYGNLVYMTKTKVNTQINSGVDIDFYVSCEKLTPFYFAMIPLFQGTTIKSYEASFYCKSFLRKNGIRTVYKILRQEAPDQLSEMDIMAVRNARSPLNVVTNFDLTVCQVWYDGTSVKATDPEHVLNKVTYLQGDYVKTYLQGNRFLDWRLSKYSQRGFKIVGDPAALALINPLDILGPAISEYGCRFTDEQRVHIRDDPKRWLIRALLRFSITGKYVVNGTLGDYGIQKVFEYITPEKNELKTKISPLDGYDTDDFVENPQLLRDKIMDKQDPVVGFASTFFDLFDTMDDKNPFKNVFEYDGNMAYIDAYREIKALKPKVLEYIPPPAPPAPAGGRRMTRRHR